jgi:hypothetical protein
MAAFSGRWRWWPAIQVDGLLEVMAIILSGRRALRERRRRSGPGFLAPGPARPASRPALALAFDERPEDIRLGDHADDRSSPSTTGKPPIRWSTMSVASAMAFAGAVVTSCA